MRATRLKGKIGMSGYTMIANIANRDLRGRTQNPTQIDRESTSTLFDCSSKSSVFVKRIQKGVKKESKRSFFASTYFGIGNLRPDLRFPTALVQVQRPDSQFPTHVHENAAMSMLPHVPLWLVCRLLNLRSWEQ